MAKKANDREYKIEQYLLISSVLLTGIMGIAGIIVGVHINSTAITVDGMYCLIALLSSYLILIASQKINSPFSAKFQFGYFKLEPIVIAFEGIMIITTCLYALSTAARDLIHTHQVKSFFIPAVFQGVVAIGCLIMAFLFFLYAKPKDNRLLLSQGIVWLIDGLQSTFIAVAFSLGILLKNTAWASIIPYIDPILVICLIFIIIREPIKLLKASSEDLLDVAPQSKLSKQIDTLIHQYLKENNLDNQVDRIIKRKAGRAIFVYIMFSPTIHVSAQHLFKIKQDIEKSLSHKIDYLYLFLTI
ncbi:cation transporter [Legionella nagasakiensis]|uniref:cation transporter n=1 Tax=Legionella nagasakiensis TaxID=535290 RepID=UPI001054DA99|nr:cation transporter [Legionella nagasakiensis]